MTALARPRLQASFRAALVLAVAATSAGCGGKPAGPQMPPPEVGAVEIRATALPLDLEYAARLRGVREVEVRSRVSGILLEKRFQEGSRVEAGQLLFRIDPAPFKAEVARARAQAAVQRAEFARAERERDRLLPLYAKNAISRRDRDAAIAAYESARAALDAAEAAQRTAELDLSYTEVRAPIAGLTSREVRSEGSLVTAGTDSSLLTHLVQADRLYVEFAVPAAEASRLQRALAGGGRNAVGVDLVGADGQVVARGAKVEFVAPAIGDETGTVAVRAAFDNREAALLPGAVVRARLSGVALADVITLPKRAVLRGQQGTFVWVVDSDGKAAPRPVRLGLSNGNDVEIADGLKPGERAVVDGIMKVQPGLPVKAMPVQPPAPVARADAPGAAAGERS